MALLDSMKIDSLIFDLDGTLWDSSEVVFRGWKRAISEAEGIKGPLSRETLESFMGLQLNQIGERFLGYLDEGKRNEILNKCCEVSNELLRKEGGSLYTDVETVLKNLSKRFPLFIVSNCDLGYIEAFFSFHRLRKYFKDFECPGNTGLSKAENIKLVIERNNLKKPIYIGDTQGDSDAAHKAGVPFIYASYGFGKTRRFDYSIDEIGGLTKLI
jgi:phosphoglycolate phosphatase